MMVEYGDKLLETVNGVLRRVGWLANERADSDHTPIPTFDFIERAEQYLQAYHDLPDRSHRSPSTGQGMRWFSTP